MNANVSQRLRSLATVAVVCTIPLLTACEWFSDFKRTPMLSTWEPIHCDARGANCDTTIASRGNPQFSVPVYGMTRAAFETSYRPFPQTIDSMSNLVNPTPMSQRSLDNGHKYFEINCSVCHGHEGNGDGPATKYGVPGLSLKSAVAMGYTDGYIYGMIRNGRGAMPSYNRIEDMDRWDVVNYVRALQGHAAGLDVKTGPLAAPGVTGRWVPGPTQTAPTKPSPFVAPVDGSAKDYYHNGERPPVSDPDAVPVGPPHVDSMLYKEGHVKYMGGGNS